MATSVTGGHRQLKALLKDFPANIAALDELDETSLNFLHATVSADHEEMKQRVIETTSVFVFRLFSAFISSLSSDRSIY